MFLVIKLSKGCVHESESDILICLCKFNVFIYCLIHRLIMEGKSLRKRNKKLSRERRRKRRKQKKKLQQSEIRKNI